MTNFEIQINKNKSKFNGIYLRNNWFKLKVGEYEINLDAYNSVEPDFIAFCVNGDNVTYFDSSEVEYMKFKIPLAIRNAYWIL